MITLPLTVVMRVAAWPSYSTSILPVWASSEPNVASTSASPDYA
jgi:hypothetical protein